MVKIDRRKALALLGFGATGSAAASAARAAIESAGRPTAVAFNHGVASGDPLQDRVIIWTAVTAETDAGGWPIHWELARDPAFKTVVAKGSAAYDFDRAGTVKVDVAGLQPGTAYFYRFRVEVGDGWAVSPVGRTQTLPKGPTKDVVLAVCTCALYQHGYFNAYEAIAKLPRVDAVLHLGDYIYEYGGPKSYGTDSPVAIARAHDPAHDCVTLDDYRRRFAQYRTDPQLQAAHARAPWICVWDDHETANDSWMHGAQNHRPAEEGDWDARKAAAVKAYFEWIPIREPADGGFAINRSFDFGDVASLFMLETRLTARDQQMVYARDLPKAPTSADVAAFRKRLDDPGRKMMSAGQEAWLRKGVAASVTSGRPWQVIGNEVVMARLDTPPVRKLMGEDAYAKAVAALPASGAEWLGKMESSAALGLPVGLDQWDGYPADRERLYSLLAATKANAIVVSGDSHAFWANELHAGSPAGRRVAVEFGAPGITSPGAGEAMPTIPIGDLMQRHNREVRFSEHSSNGFVLLTLSHREAKGELMAVSTVFNTTYTSQVLKTFTATPGPAGVSALEAV